MRPETGPAAVCSLDARSIVTQFLDERNIDCPFCGERICILIDTSEGSQSYVEDCQVCCRPIHFMLIVDADDNASVHVDCS